MFNLITISDTGMKKGVYDRYCQCDPSRYFPFCGRKFTACLVGAIGKNSYLLATWCRFVNTMLILSSCLNFNAVTGGMGHEVAEGIDKLRKQKARLSFLKRAFQNLAPLTGLELHLYILLLLGLLV